MKANELKRSIPELDNLHIKLIKYSKRIEPYISRTLFIFSYIYFALRVILYGGNFIINLIGLIGQLLFLFWYFYMASQKRLRPSRIEAFELICSLIIFLITLIIDFFPVIIINIGTENIIIPTSLILGIITLYLFSRFGGILTSGYELRSERFKNVSIKRYHEINLLLKDKIAYISEELRKKQSEFQNEVQKMHNILNPYTPQEFALYTDSPDWEHELNALKILDDQVKLLEELFMREAQLYYVEENTDVFTIVYKDFFSFCDKLTYEYFPVLSYNDVLRIVKIGKQNQLSLEIHKLVAQLLFEFKKKREIQLSIDKLDNYDLKDEEIMAAAKIVFSKIHPNRKLVWSQDLSEQEVNKNMEELKNTFI